MKLIIIPKGRLRLKCKTMDSSNKPTMIKKGIFIFLFVVAALFGVGAIVMYLWNAILPDLIHVSPIQYWQALGLLALCKILFGGFKFGGGGRHWGNRNWGQKFSNMSEEEKEALKAKWKDRCGPKNN